MRASRRVLIPTGIALVAGLVIFGTLSLQVRAPERTTLETFSKDLEVALREAGTSPQRYAYRLSHYCEALKGKDWRTVRAALIEQGAYLRSASEESGEIVLPERFAFRLGPYRLNPHIRIVAARKFSGSGPAPTQYPISLALGLLQLEGDVPFADLKKALPPKSFLGVALSAPVVEKQAKRFPVIKDFPLEYVSDSALRSVPAGGQLRIEMSLAEREREFGATVNCTATSELEPTPERIFKWIPLTVMRSRDRWGALAWDTYVDERPSKNFLYLASRRNDESNETWTTPPTVYSHADIEALDDSVNDIILGKGLLRIDLKKLRRLKNLRVFQVDYDVVLKEADIQAIAALPKIEELSLQTISSKSLREIAKMLRLKRLSFRTDLLTRSDLNYLAKTTKLSELSLIGKVGLDDATLKLLADRHPLTKLTIPRARSFTLKGLKAITSKGKLTELGVSFRGLPDDAPECLTDLKHAKTLFVDSATFSEKTIRGIAQLKDLRDLILNDVRGLNQKTLPFFGSLRELDTIQLLNCPGATAEGLLKLKRLLPPGYRGP